MKTMKKALALIIVLTLMLSLSATSFAAKDDPIKIGISIWSSLELHGHPRQRSETHDRRGRRNPRR